MAGRRHHSHFQGQFGINETSLTTAIENGKFDLAEELIMATQDPAFLNDGPYENIPLHMVLTNNHHTDNSRNLHLAKLLVQKGANSNLRIPYGDLDRASPSPFEELVVYFEVIKSYIEGRSDILCEELDMYFELEEIKIEFITNTIDLNGVSCESTINDCYKLIKHTRDLIIFFLDHGSDPNVITTFGHKTLFHWVVEHQDVELAKQFLNTCRVNINLCDVHGNSPLMDTILRNDPTNSLSIYEAMCDTTEYINVNMQNCCGETALFRAAFVGAIDVVSKLRFNGAKIESNVCLSQVPISYAQDSSDSHQCGSLLREVPPLTTPLLAPLLSDAPTRLRFTQISSQTSVCNYIPPHKHLVDKILSSSISPLVDHGCLTSPTVACETVELLALTNFIHLKEEKIAGSDFVSLMFGKVSSGLRQLCIRTLFDHMFMISRLVNKLWTNIQTHNLCSKDCKAALTKDIICELVEKLGLPKSFSIFFELEAAKYQICKLIMGLESVDCDQACSESEESIFDDDDNDDDSFDSEDSSNYADSLFFFSSDILSEESSEELDDLSDEQLSGSTNEDDIEGCTDGRVNGVASKRNFKYETLSQSQTSSESDNLECVIESLCENIAEDVVCKGYQHENGECRTTKYSASEMSNSEGVTNVSISIFSESSNATNTSSNSSDSPEVI